MVSRNTEMLDLEFILIADAVEYVGSKLYVMGGGWNEFRSASYPAVARIGIAMSITAGWDDTNRPISARLELHSPSETASSRPLQIESTIVLGRSPMAVRGSSQRAFVAHNLALPLPRPGTYTITGFIDSQTKAIEFEAVQISPTGVIVR
jgi:hypothetical protein